MYVVKQSGRKGARERLVHAFGAKYGDLRYKSELDLDDKLAINMNDIARAATEFGQEY
jgi:hypothetical protein